MFDRRRFTCATCGGSGDYIPQPWPRILEQIAAMPEPARAEYIGRLSVRLDIPPAVPCGPCQGRGYFDE